MINENEFLTEKEACALLQVSRTTLYRLRQKENFPCYILGGVIRYTKDNIEKWLNDHTTKEVK